MIRTHVLKDLTAIEDEIGRRKEDVRAGVMEKSRYVRFIERKGLTQSITSSPRGRKCLLSSRGGGDS